MAERIIPFTNFKEGVSSVPGFFGGEFRDILNQDLNDNGFLVPRKGYTELTDRVYGTYPRGYSKTYRSTANRSDEMSYTGTQLKLGTENQPLVIAGLGINADIPVTFRIIKGNTNIAINLTGQFIESESTANVYTFPVTLPGGGIGAFEDGDEVFVVILLDDETETHLENQNRLKYSEGDQLVVAHAIGDTVDESVTRYYKVPKDTHHASIRKGQILLLADGETQSFIDVENNRAYDWILTPPKVIAIAHPDELPEFETLRASLVTSYRTNAHATPDLYSGFPSRDQTGRDNNLYGWKMTYENPDLAIGTKPANTVYIQYEQPQDSMLAWLLSGPVTYLGTTYDHRYLALLAADHITSSEASTIEAQERSQLQAVLDITDKPDWATHIGLYRAEIPLAAYGIDDIDAPGASEFSTVTTITGSALTVGGAIVASQSLVVGGAAIAIIGLISLLDNEDPDNLIHYTIDVEFISNISDEEFLLQDQHRIEGDTGEYTFEMLDNKGIEEVYLDAFYNDTPPEKLDAITIHAGRLYGVDRETEEIVFSHIDGNGISNYWSFPKANAISTTASGTTPIVKLEKMPGSGGIYVFKRDAIHYIDGQNIFSGLYDINVSAQTDISASDYKKNIGCISPRSVKNDGTVVLFVGNDDQIYQMAGKQASPIGSNIKPYISALTIEEQQDIVTEWHNERFYLTLPDSVLILNTERKYWTRFDWDLKDVQLSRGGQNAENIFYGLTDDDRLVELLTDNPDEVFGIKWEQNTELLPAGSRLTGVYVYTDDGEEITITVKGNEPVREQVRTFTPKLGNRYRMGCHVKGRNMEIKVESENPVTIDRILLEVNV